MESPALPEPPYDGRGSASSEGPATSHSNSQSPTRRSHSHPHNSSSPTRQPYSAGSTAAYFASSTTPQPSYGSLSNHDSMGDGQEYLGNNHNQHYNQQVNAQYDQQSINQSLNDHAHAPSSEPYPAQLSHTQSSTSLATTNSNSTSHPTPDSPRSVHPAQHASSPDPSATNLGLGGERDDEVRPGDGLGLGRIAEVAPPPPPEQHRRGSGWLPDRHDGDGHVPANFDENVLKALCDSEVSNYLGWVESTAWGPQALTTLEPCSVRNASPARPPQARNGKFKG